MQIASDELKTVVKRVAGDFIKECYGQNAHFGYLMLATDEWQALAILHWTSPYKSPWDLDSSHFFVDNRYCGVGSGGLDQALQTLTERRPRFVLFVGNLHDLDSSVADDSPFGPEEDEVLTKLDQSGIERIFLEEPALQGWGFIDVANGKNSVVIICLTSTGVAILALLAGVLVYIRRRRNCGLHQSSKI